MGSANDQPPALPGAMSSDGREVWAWGNRLSQYTGWLEQKRRHREDIRINTGVCGSCDKWMKSRECPRERNVSGMTRGPSSGSPACGQFVWCARSKAFVDQRAAALAALEAAGPYGTTPEDVTQHNADGGEQNHGG